MKLAIFLALLVSISAHATTEEDCEGLLFEPIARTVMPGYALEVRGPRGEIATATDSLSRLKDGEYIFLATTRNHVIVSRKFDVAGYERNGRGLVTHKSLLLKLEESLGSEIGLHIGGAGEFSIRNGKVSILSNRSGNFRGYQMHFEFAERKLKEFGLPVEPSTFRKIIKEGEKEDRGHTPASMHIDEYRLQMMSGLRASPFNREIAAIFFELHRQLAQLYPDANLPGEFDMDRSTDDLLVPMILAQRYAAVDAPSLVIAILFERRKPDGLEASLIRKLYLQEDPDYTREENDRARDRHRLRLVEAVDATLREIGRHQGREFESRPDWYDLRLRLGRLKASVLP